MKSDQPKNLRRRLMGIGAATVMVASLGTGVASAQSSMPQLPQIPGAPAAPQAPTQQDINKAVNDTVLGARDNIHAQTAPLPGEIREPINQNVDNAVNFLAPGALAAREQARAAAAAAAKNPAPTERTTPCPASAHACVNLEGRDAWLQTNGQTTYGPVKISSGRQGEETPKGKFYVTRKVKDEVSHEFNDAPMPYSVYFTNQGHAFHQGDVNVESAGCIHLSQKDAAAFFDQLQVGDEVYIY